jgi:transposase
LEISQVNPPSEAEPHSYEELVTEVAKLREAVEVLSAQLAARDTSIAEKDARITELERLLSDSRRSGKRQAAPFSKGAPKEEPARPGRKRGEAHGRHGHRMAPTGPVDRELEATLPSCCPDCGGELELERVAERTEVDLPEMAPVTTRFRVPVARCRSCRRRVQGRHPEQSSDALGAAAAGIGPSAKSFAAWLHYGLGLSFAKSTALLRRLGIEVTAGAICQASQATGTALVPVQAEIVAKVNAAPMVVPDETGWRVEAASAWLWAAASEEATAYWVADGRGFEEASIVIDPDYQGVLVRDGWAPYRRFTAATHQTCYAHLTRRCHELIDDLPGFARGTPRQVAEILEEALAARELPPERRSEVAADLAERVELLCAGPVVHDECRKLLAHLSKEHDALFTFLLRDVDATNWRAEQAIRPAVVNRKVWGGNRTWRGAATQGRMASVIRTAAQQGIDVVTFLAAVARAPTPAEIPSLFA